MEKAIIISNICPIMKKPKYDSELIDEVLYGMIITLTKRINKHWYKIKTHYNYEGYIHKRNFITNKKNLSFWQSQNKSIINNHSVDVLYEPKVQSTKIITLTMGTIVSITNYIQNDYMQVLLPDFKKGFVKNKFISPLVTNYNFYDENIFRELVVKTAINYLNTQYRWGGKTPLGIDCSGLTSMAYMLNGAIIYRDAKINHNFPIRKIPIQEIKKADLLYFPGHIALYIGDGKFIHSQEYNCCVKINSFKKKDKGIYRYDMLKSLYAVGSIF